jgi:hypothetical protein
MDRKGSLLTVSDAGEVKDDRLEKRFGMEIRLEP